MNFTKQDIVYKQVAPTEETVLPLIEKLNQYQIELYGFGDCTLESPESLQKNNAYMIGAFFNEKLLGIGAVKLMEGYAEIKRMYIDEPYRGLSIAETILLALESYAIQNQMSVIRLETGNKHYAALKFYRKSGYHEINRFGNYKANEISIYFEKQIDNSIL